MRGEWLCDGGSACSWDIHGYEETHKVRRTAASKRCEWLSRFDALEVPRSTRSGYAATPQPRAAICPATQVPFFLAALLHLWSS